MLSTYTLLKSLHFCILFGYRSTVSNLSGIDCEEIYWQDVGNTTQKFYVNVVLLENLVDVGTGAAEPAGEPRDCPPLLLKRLLYQLSNMYHHVRKSVGIIPLLIPTLRPSHAH